MFVARMLRLAGHILALGLPTLLPAATPTVTSTADSGAGTPARRDHPAEQVEFDIAGAGVHTIDVATELPTITDPLVIDGTTQPGFSGGPLIELTTSGPATGLRIDAGGSTVRGLSIHGFGINLQFHTNGGNTVESCYIGTDPTGTVTSAGHGVYLQNSPDTTVGGPRAAQGNPIPPAPRRFSTR
jgi:nitrous oxidase accessory protein NosD